MLERFFEERHVEGHGLLVVVIGIPVLVPGGGLVGPGLRMPTAVVVHQVRRVGHHGRGTLVAHQARDVCGLGRIATQQTMVTQEPEIAVLRGRLGWQLGNEVGVGLASGRAQKQGADLVWVEADDVDVVVKTDQLADLQREQVAIPGRLLVRAVIGQAIGLCLSGGEVTSDVYRDCLETQAPGGQQARVADHDHVLCTDHDRLAEAELLE